MRANVRPVGARPRRERSRRIGGGSKSSQGGQGSRQGGQRSSLRAPQRSQPRVTPLASRLGNPAEWLRWVRHRDRRNGQRHQPLGPPPNRSKATTHRDGVGGSSSNGSGRPAPEKAPKRSNEAKETEDMAEGMTLEEQGEVGRAFVADLLSEFGMQGSVETAIRRGHGRDRCPR